ncbi:MAG: polysaccharide deacetylase family protein [Acidobacteriota bacterium]|nr:polysaccharide deacetylase family protein [Acidobacteriota bacterium]
MATGTVNSTSLTLGGVPVLMYHDICAEAANPERYAVPLPLFHRHLEVLRELHTAVIDLPALRQFSSLPRAVLTFDDGLHGNFSRALPELVSRGMTATFFVTTSLIGTAGYLTWDQLREMSAAGMTIGSHGHRHIAYTALTAQYAANELTRSRLMLEDALGSACEAFSAPFGFLNGSTFAAARAAGFAHICSSRPWPAAAGDKDIPRLVVYRYTNAAEFAALVTGSPWPILVRRTRDALLHLPKQWMLRARPQRLGLEANEAGR